MNGPNVIYVPQRAWAMNDADWTPPPPREMTHEELWAQRLLLGPGVQDRRGGEGLLFTACAVVLATLAAFMWSALL